MKDKKQKTNQTGSDSENKLILELEAKLEQQSQQLEQLKNSLTRALADYDNLQKRMQKDVEQLIFNRVIDVSEDLIEIKDNLDLALKEENKVNEGWIKGIIEIVSQIPRLLSELGITEINPSKGDVFNPEQHEAIMVNRDKNVDGKFINETLQPGYMLESKIIRPAKVVVTMK